jgi:hypothetical protein
MMNESDMKHTDSRRIAARRRLMLIVPGIMMLLNVAMAQDLRFDATVFDFGPTLQGTKLSHVFRFVNESCDTLFIDEPKSSCTCTAAVLSDGFIVPGLHGSVLVEYLPLFGLIGETEKTLALGVRNNRGDAWLVELRVKAKMEAEAHTDPMMLHCEMQEGESRSMNFDLVSNSSDTLVVWVQTAAFMQYADTSAAGDGRPAHLVATPFVDFELRSTDAAIPPGGRKTYTLTMQGKMRSRISGSIRFVMPHSDLRVAVTADIFRIRSPG